MNISQKISPYRAYRFFLLTLFVDAFLLIDQFYTITPFHDGVTVHYQTFDILRTVWGAAFFIALGSTAMLRFLRMHRNIPLFSRKQMLATLGILGIAEFFVMSVYSSESALPIGFVTLFTLIFLSKIASILSKQTKKPINDVVVFYSSLLATRVFLFLTCAAAITSALPSLLFISAFFFVCICLNELSTFARQKMILPENMFRK